MPQIVEGGMTITFKVSSVLQLGSLVQNFCVLRSLRARCPASSCN